MVNKKLSPTCSLCSFSFEVQGIPIAQPRARAARMGNSIRMYTPKSHPITNWKMVVGLSARRAKDGLKSVFACGIDILDPQKPSKEFVVNPSHKIFVTAGFYFPHLKATKAKDKCARYKNSKPDVDNLIKGLLDALNDSGVWSDDNQVCSITAYKAYVNGDAAPFTYCSIDIHGDAVQ